MIDQNTPSDAYVSPESTGASAEDIVNRFESEEALVSAVANLSPTEFVDRYASDSPQNGKKLYDDVSFALQKQKEEMLIQKASQMEGPYAPNEYAELPGWIPFIGGSYAPGDVATNGAKGALATIMQSTGSVGKAVSDSAKTLFDKDLAYSGVSSKDLVQRRQTLKDIENTDLGYVDEDTKEYARNIRAKLDRQKELRYIIENSYNAEEKAKAEQELSALSLNQAEFDFSQTDTYKNIVKFEDARAREEEFSRLENNLKNHWGLNNQRYQKALSNPKNIGDAFIKIRSMLADTSGLLAVSAASGGVLGKAGGLAAKAFNLGYKGIYTGSNAAVLSGFSLWKPITWGKGVKVVTSGKWVVPAMKHVGLATASVLPMTMQESAENRAEAIFKRYENGMPTNLTTGDQITLLGAALINDVGTAMLPTMRFIPKLGKSAAFNKAANTAFLEVTKEFPKITAKAMENSMATGISFTKGVRAAVATEAFKALEKYGKDGLVVGELKAFANYLGALTQDSIALGLTTFAQQAMKDMTAAGYLRSEDFVSAVMDYMTGSDYSKNKRESFYAGLMAIPLAAPRASKDFAEATKNASKYAYDKKIRDYRNVALFNSDEAIEYDRLDRVLDQPRVDKATYAKNAKEITKAVQSGDVATIAAKTGLSSEYVQNVLESSDPVDAIVGFTDMMGVTLDKAKKIKSRQAELESAYRDKVTSGIAGLSIGPKDVYKKGASGSNRFIRHFKEIVNMSSNKQALGELALAYRNYALTKDVAYKDQINQILKDNAHNSEFSLANAALRRVSDEMYTSHKFDNEIGKYASKLRDSSSTSKVEANTNPLDAIWDSDEDLKNLWEKAGSAALTDDDRSKVIQIRARIQDVINRYTAGRTAANAAEYDAVIKKGHALLQSIDALGNVSNTARTLAERFKVEDIQDLIASNPTELARLEGTPIGEAVKLQKFIGNSITGSGKKGILVHLSDMFEMAAKQDLAGILARLNYLVEQSEVHHGLFPTQVPETKLRDTNLKNTPNGEQIAKTEYKLLQDITATYFPMLEKFLDLTADPQDTMLYHVKNAMKSLSDTYLQGATPFNVNSEQIPALERYVEAIVKSLKAAQESSEKAAEKAEKYAKEHQSKSTSSYDIPQEVEADINDINAGSILAKHTPFYTAAANEDSFKTGLGKSIMGTLSKIFPSFFISPDVTKNYPPLMDVDTDNKQVTGNIHFSKIAYNLGIKDIIKLLRATTSIKAEIPVNLIHSKIPANPKEKQKKQLTGFIRKVQINANSELGMHLYNILKLFTAADLGSLSAYSKKIRYHQNNGEYVLEDRKIKHNSYEFIAEILANLYKGVYLIEGAAENDADALYSLFDITRTQGTAGLPKGRNIEAVFNGIISNNDTQAFSTPLLENLFRNTAFYGIVSPWMDSTISKYNTNNANENDNLAKIARISKEPEVKAYLEAHNINTFNELLTNYNNNREAIKNLNPDLESALKSISINKQAADVLGRIPLAIQASFVPVQVIPGTSSNLLRWEYKPDKAKEVLLKLGKQGINLDNPNGFFNLFGIMFEDASGKLPKPEDVTNFHKEISQRNLDLYNGNKLSGAKTSTNTDTNTDIDTDTSEVDLAKQQRIAATNNLIRSMILPQSTDAVTYTPTDTRNLIIRSGGAYGADTLWGMMARVNGVPKDHIIHYLGRTKDNSLTSLNELGFENYTGTTLDLAPEAEARYKEYAEKHGIKVDSEEDLRGISQVLGENLTDPADAVIAVAPLNLESVNEEGYFNVSGGTGTAVNVAILNNIPTLVLNTNDNKWYSYNSNKNEWVEKSAVGFIKESSTVAMIGTRNINYEGNSYLEKYKDRAFSDNKSASLINEMRRVFLDEEMETKGSNPPPQEVTPTDAELTNQINDEIISAYNAEKTKEEEADSNEEENAENPPIDDVAVDPSDVTVDEEESILESSVSGAEVANNIAYLYGLFRDIDLTTNKAEAVKRLQNILENPKNIGNITISDKITVFKTKYIERLAEFYNQYKGDNATNKAIRENIVSSVVDHYILYNNIRNSLYNHLVVSSTNENEITIGKDIEAIDSKYANKHRYIFSVLKERGITPQSLDKELSNPDGNFVRVFRETLQGGLLGTSVVEAKIRDLIRNPYTVLKMANYLLSNNSKRYNDLYSGFDEKFNESDNSGNHYKFSKDKVFKPVLIAFYSALLSLNSSETLKIDSLKEAVDRVAKGESTLGTAYFRDSTVDSTKEFKDNVKVAKQAITGTLLNSPAIRAKFASSLTGFIFTDLVKASSKEVNVSSLAPFSGLSVDRPIAEHISAILSQTNGEELYKELTTRPNLGKVSTLVTKLGKYLVTKAGVGKILSEFSKDGKPLTAYQKNLINIMLGQIALKHLTALQYIALSGMNDNSLALVPDLVYDEASNSFQVRQPKNQSSKIYIFSGKDSLFQEVKNLANQDKTKAFSDYVLATAFGEKHVSYSGLVKVSSKNSQGERVPKEYREATQKYVDQGFAIDPQIMSLFTEILDREFTVNGATKSIRDFFIGWLNNYDENTANVFLDKVFGSNALKELEALNMFLGLEDPRTVFEYDAVGIVARNRETIKALLNLSMAQAKWEAAKNEIDDTITDTETYDNSWIFENWEELKNSPYIHAWFSVNPGSNFRCFQQGVEYNPSSQKSFTRYTMYRAPNVMESASLAYNRENAYRVNQVLSYSILQNFDQKPEKKVQWDQFTDKAKELINRLDKNGNLTRLLQAYKAHGYRYEDAGLWKAMFDHMEAEGLELENTKIQMLNIVKTLAQFTNSDGKLQFTKTGLFKADGRKVYNYILAETDGVTNGSAIGLITNLGLLDPTQEGLITDKEWDFLNKVGIYKATGDGPKSIHEYYYDESGNKKGTTDMYENLQEKFSIEGITRANNGQYILDDYETSNLLKLVLVVKYGLLDQTAINNKIDEIWEKMPTSPKGYTLEFAKEVNEYLKDPSKRISEDAYAFRQVYQEFFRHVLERSDTKYPFMTFNYSAGVQAITRDLLINRMLPEALKHLTKDLNSTKDPMAKKAKVITFFRLVAQLCSNTEYSTFATPQNLNRISQGFRNNTITTEALNPEFSKIFGMSVEEAAAKYNNNISGAILSGALLPSEFKSMSNLLEKLESAKIFTMNDVSSNLTNKLIEAMVKPFSSVIGEPLFETMYKEFPQIKTTVGTVTSTIPVLAQAVYTISNRAKQVLIATYNKAHPDATVTWENAPKELKQNYEKFIRRFTESFKSPFGGALPLAEFLKGQDASQGYLKAGGFDIKGTGKNAVFTSPEKQGVTDRGASYSVLGVQSTDAAIAAFVKQVVGGLFLDIYDANFSSGWYMPEVAKAQNRGCATYTIKSATSSIVIACERAFQTFLDQANWKDAKLGIDLSNEFRSIIADSLYKAAHGSAILESGLSDPASAFLNFYQEDEGTILPSELGEKVEKYSKETEEGLDYVGTFLETPAEFQAALDSDVHSVKVELPPNLQKIHKLFSAAAVAHVELTRDPEKEEQIKTKLLNRMNKSLKRFNIPFENYFNFVKGYATYNIEASRVVDFLLNHPNLDDAVLKALFTYPDSLNGPAVYHADDAAKLATPAYTKQNLALFSVSPLVHCKAYKDAHSAALKNLNKSGLIVSQYNMNKGGEYIIEPDTEDSTYAESENTANGLFTKLDYEKALENTDPKVIKEVKGLIQEFRNSAPIKALNVKNRTNEKEAKRNKARFSKLDFTKIANSFYDIVNQVINGYLDKIGALNEKALPVRQYPMSAEKLVKVAGFDPNNSEHLAISRRLNDAIFTYDGIISILNDLNKPETWLRGKAKLKELTKYTKIDDIYAALAGMGKIVHEQNMDANWKDKTLDLGDYKESTTDSVTDTEQVIPATKDAQEVPTVEPADTQLSRTFEGVEEGVANFVDALADIIPDGESAGSDAFYSDATMKDVETLTLSEFNALDVFDKLPDDTAAIGSDTVKLCSEPHKGFLRSLVEKSMKGIKALTMVLGTTDKDYNYGLAQKSIGSIDAKRIALYRSLNAVKKSGLPYSMQELMAHELTHMVWWSLDNADPLYQELRQAYARFRSNYTKPEDFMILKGLTPGSAEYQAELAAAQKRMDYIFGTGKDSAKDPIREFATFAMTNETFRDMLARVPTEQETKKTGLAGLLETIADIFGRLIDKLFGKAEAGKFKRTENLLTTIDAIHTIALERMSSYREISKIAKVADASAQTLDKLDTKLKTVTDKISLSSGIKSFMATDFGKKLRSAKFLGELAGELGIDGSPENLRKGLLFSMINHVAKINKARQQQIGIDTKFLRGSFKNTTLSPHTSKALTEGILRTDLQSLKEGTNYDYIYKIMTDSAYRASELQRARNEIIALEPAAKAFLLNSCNSLANYMVKGKYLYDFCNHSNCYQIANLWGIGNKPAVSNNLDRRIALCNSYTTLKAYELLDDNTKNILAETAEKEFEASFKDNGIITLINYQENHLKEGYKAAGKDYIRVLHKGYLKDKTNPYYRVVKSYNKDSYVDLIKKGFEEFQAPNALSIPKGSNKKYLYNTIASPNIYVTGAIATIDNKARGYSVISEPDTKSYGVPITQYKKDRCNSFIRSKMADINKFLTMEDYNYNNENPTLNTAFDSSGSIVDLQENMTNEFKDTILERSHDFSELAARTAASYTEITDSIHNNEILMKVLVQDQLENQADIAANPETWINVSPQSTGAGLEAYIMLPEETKRFVRSLVGEQGLYVRLPIFNQVFGYREKTLVNLMENQHILNKMDLPFKCLSSFINEALGNKAGMHFGGYWRFATAYAKDTIVVRSFLTTFYNILSNMVLLLHNGIPLYDVLKSHVDGYRYISQYKKALSRVTSLENELSYKANSTEKALELQKEYALAKADLISNPMYEIMQKGALTTIESDEASTDYGILGKKLAPSLENFHNKMLQSNSKAIIAMRNMLMVHGSTFYKLAQDFASGSDTIAKWVMYKNDVRSRGSEKDKNNAFLDAADLFVNYDLPTNEWIQWANQVGLMNFTKFMFRIGRPLLKLTSKHPARVLGYLSLKMMLISLGFTPFSFDAYTAAAWNPGKWTSKLAQGLQGGPVGSSMIEELPVVNLWRALS